MKILKIIGFVLIGIFVAALIGGYFYIKNFDVDQYRPQVIAKVSENIHRDVGMGPIALSFSFDKGVGLSVKDFTIKDSSEFSNDNMLTVASVWLNVDAMRLIQSKKLVVKEVLINEPVINFIQSSDGKTNWAAIGQKSESAQSETKESESEADDPVATEINIQQLKIEDARVFLNISNEAQSQHLELNDIDFQLQNFVFAQSVPFNGGVAVFNDEQNIQFQGTLFVNPITQRFELNNVRMDMDLAKLDVKTLQSQMPQAQDLALTEPLSGKISFNVFQFVVIPGQVPVIDLQGQVDSLRIVSSHIDGAVDNVRMDIVSKAGQVNIDNLHANLLGGQIDGEADIIDIFTRPKAVTKIKADGLALAKILANQELPLDIEGVVGVDANLGADLTQDIDMSSVFGEFTLNVKQGRLVEFNVLDTVLSKISFIPNLSEKLYQNLPPKYKEKLTAKDTAISVFNVKGTIKNGLLQYLVDLQADEFLADIRGNLDQDMYLTNQTFVAIPAELSGALVQSVGELAALLDRNQRIAVPFKPYSGPADKISLQPNIEEVGKKVIQQKGKEELRKVIFKALDIEEVEPEPAPTNGQPAEPAQEPKKSSEQQLIEGILNEIPLFK